MLIEAEGAEMRVRGEVKVPSSGWNDQWVDGKLGAFLFVNCMNAGHQTPALCVRVLSSKGTEGPLCHPHPAGAKAFVVCEDTFKQSITEQAHLENLSMFHMYSLSCIAPLYVMPLSRP